MDIYIYIWMYMVSIYMGVSWCLHIYVRNLWNTMIQQVNIACFK